MTYLEFAQNSPWFTFFVLLLLYGGLEITYSFILTLCGKKKEGDEYEQHFD